MVRVIERWMNSLGNSFMSISMVNLKSFGRLVLSMRSLFCVTLLFWFSGVFAEEILKVDIAPEVNSEISLEQQLMGAIKEDSVLSLELALQSGANPDSNVQGLPIIFRTVVDSCNFDLLQTLIEAGATVNIRENISGAYPIHWAVIHDDDSCFDLLMQNGADQHVVDFEGRNLYFMVVDFGSKSILDKLYDLDIELMKKNNLGMDAVHWSLIMKRYELFEDLLARYIVDQAKKDLRSNENE